MSFRSALIAAVTANKPYKRRLEYLESTGAQWIDSGITPVTDDVWEFYIDGLLAETDSNKWLFGNYEGGTSILIGSYLGKFYMTFALDVNKANSITFDNNRHVFINNMSGKCYVDDQILGELTVAKITNDFSYSLLYFGRYFQGSNKQLVRGRIYNARASNRSVTALSFIPVLWGKGVPYVDGNTNQQVTPAADKPGMYDLVSKRLYVNQGTGADFLYG